MTDARWLYPPELAGALTAFGLAPTPGTSPAVVRDQLNDLYRFELRRLRGRLLASEFTRSEYLERVIAMRKQYWPLTLPLAAWEKICSPTGSE